MVFLFSFFTYLYLLTEDRMEMRVEDIFAKEVYSSAIPRIYVVGLGVDNLFGRGQ